MKRVIFFGTCLVVFFVSIVSVSALRLGLEAGNPPAVLIIRPSPFDIKIGYSFADILGDGGGDYIHISADYRIIDSYQLIDFLHVFLSLGVYAQIYMGDQTDTFGIGARIPVGLQAFLMKKTIEIFIEIVPTVSFLPSLYPPWENPRGGFQGYIGFTVKTPW